MTDRDEIRKLVREALEGAMGSEKPGPTTYAAPWTGVEYQAHPSGRLFNIDEAATRSAELIDLIESKLCTIEKNRSCDQCGMCRTLGF